MQLIIKNCNTNRFEEYSDAILTETLIYTVKLEIR